MIRTVMLSLEVNANNIKYISDEYKKQLKTLKADSTEPENDLQIKAIEEKVEKLFSIKWDMEDAYEDLEEVISPMKADKAKSPINIKYGEDQNTIYKRAIEELNENAANLEMVAEEEQEALDSTEEHFPGSMRAMEMEEYVTTLGMVIDEIYDIVAALEAMIG